MKERAVAITTQEVALFLRRALGPHVCEEWSHALAEMRSDENTSVHGVRLLPAARTVINGKRRPVYSAEAVEEFVRELVRQIEHTGLIRPGAPVRLLEIEVDPDDERPWRNREAVLCH